MLSEGRLPLSDAEHQAVDKLQGEHPDESVTVTRRDPGETGPLVAQVGDDSWEIGEDGKRKKL
jgi:hypothetical protein